jgi:hypothetical protein
MSYWSSRCSMVWHRSQKIGTDSLLLMSKLVKSPNSSRDILLSQARQANAAATSFLRVEREISLMKYHGFLGYLHERNLFYFNAWSQRLRLGLGPAPPVDQNKNQTTRSSSNIARIAFMITATQRAALSSSLGYSPEQIKHLKPVEASLILEHKVQPIDMDSRLPRLVQEYHASLSAGNQKVNEMPPAVETHEPQHSAPEEEQLEGDTTTTTTILSLPTLENFLENTSLWYEVVAIMPDGTETVGLYRDESEAELCLETKEYLRAKHTPDDSVRFQIRTTHK